MQQQNCKQNDPPTRHILTCSLKTLQVVVNSDHFCCFFRPVYFVDNP